MECKSTSGEIVEKTNTPYEGWNRYVFKVKQNNGKTITGSVRVDDVDEEDPKYVEVEKKKEMVKAVKQDDIVTMKYFDTVKGAYTYHNILNIVVGDSIATEEVIGQGEKSVTGAKKTTSPPQSEPPPQSVWDEKDRRIVRQNSNTNAVVLLNSMIEAHKQELINKEELFDLLNVSSDDEQWLRKGVENLSMFLEGIVYRK